MRRRQFLAGFGTTATAVLAGCTRRQRTFQFTIGNGISADVSVQLVFALQETQVYKNTHTLGANKATTIEVNESVAIPPVELLDGPPASLQATVDTGMARASDILQWTVTDQCDLRAYVQIDSTVSEPSITVGEPCVN